MPDFYTNSPFIYTFATENELEPNILRRDWLSGMGLKNLPIKFSEFCLYLEKIMNENSITLKKWVDGWEKTQVELTSVKSVEMSKDSYAFLSLSSLTEIFNYSLAHSQPRPYSGLVEMQKYFSKLHRK